MAKKTKKQQVAKKQATECPSHDADGYLRPEAAEGTSCICGRKGEEAKPEPKPTEQPAAKPEPVSLNRFSTEALVAELNHRKQVPLEYLPDGAYFNLAPLNEEPQIGMKVKGFPGGDVQVTMDGRTKQYWASAAMVWRWSAPGAAVPEEKDGKAAVKSNSTPKPGQSKKSSIFGFPMTAVVRWMGAQKWSFEKAMAALTRLGCKTTEASVKTFLRAGAKGERGELPKLTEKQAEELSK